jgi:hypothetical protein
MLYRRCRLSFRWERSIFEGPPSEKPFVQSIPNFDKITNVLTSCYKPTLITIAPRGSSAQYGDCSLFVYQFFYFFNFLSRPSPESVGRFSRLVPQTTLFATRKCLSGVSLMRNFFRWRYPFHRLFRGHCARKSKKSITF